MDSIIRPFFKVPHGSHEEILAQVIDLDQSQFPNPWKSSGWGEVIGSTRFRLSTLCSKKGELRGFILFDRIEEDPCAHLLKIIIDKPHRSFGQAQALYKVSLEAMRSAGILSVFLEVATDNLEAIRFYEKVGFENHCVKRNFYGHGVDAFAMSHNF